MKTVQIPYLGSFKFILIRTKKKHFIFGDVLPYHSDIFEKFTQLNPGDFKVEGGGKISIENKTIKVYGKSNVYGPFDKKIVKEIMGKYCKKMDLKLEIE